MAKKTISDWLGFIRPHVNEYLTRSPGERGQYLDEVSKISGLSNNTLRRFIAASQFLEGEGITSIPRDGKMPVGAVERIARIGKRDPGRVRKLLDQLSSGELTIASLRDDLKESKLKWEILGDDGYLSDEELSSRTRLHLLKAGFPDSEAITTTRAGSHEFNFLFDRVLSPRLQINWPGVGSVLVIGDKLVNGTAAGFADGRRAFYRNIVLGVALFDYVVVFTDGSKDEVTYLLDQLRPADRKRVYFPIAKTFR